MAVAVFAAAISAEKVSETLRDYSVPEGLSDITRSPEGRFWCVDDRGGRLYECALTVSATNTITRFAIVRKLNLKGRADLEGCAVDPLRTGVIWVSDEKDVSVRGYEIATGREIGSVPLPSQFRSSLRPNQSLEALAISPDGLRLWVINETAPARLLEFTRASADDAWRFCREQAYAVDPLGGKPWQGYEISGVSALCALEKGRLLVLEREFSQKRFMPTFRTRIYLIDADVVQTPLAKRLVWEDCTYAVNYEGLCRGPRLADGRESLVLVSDAGGGADAAVLLLALPQR